MNNFGKALLFKNSMLIVSIILLKLIPSNKEIKELSYKLNELESIDDESIDKSTYSEEVRNFVN